jgi:Flp pilus assembly protein TadB
MIGIGLLAGVLAATVVLAAVAGLAPQPVRLADRLRTALEPATTDQSSREGLLARWQHRLLPTDDRLDAALAITGVRVERLVIRRLLWTGGGLVVPMLFWPAGLAALGTPLLAAPMVGLIGGAAGWWLAVHELHDQAARRRREMSLALAAYLQLASTMIRAGTAEEQALRDAADAGSGWSFDALQRAMDRAVTSGASLWQTFDGLGAEFGMLELRALGAELRIAARQGSSPARTLTTRAAALREEELAAQLAAANRAEQRMALPLVGLGLSVVVFIVFPALATFIDF